MQILLGGEVSQVNEVTVLCWNFSVHHAVGIVHKYINPSVHAFFH